MRRFAPFLIAAALSAAAPHAVDLAGCLQREGPLSPAVTRGLARYRRLVKVAGPDGAYRCAIEVEGWSLKDVLGRMRPAKKAPDGFDRPLDTFVVISGRGGAKALFSWSEVFMAGDGGPILADQARLILPHHHDPLAKGASDPTVLLGGAGRDALKLERCERCHDGGGLLRLHVPEGVLLVSPQDGFGGRGVEDVSRIEIRQAGVEVKGDRALGKTALVEVPDLVALDGARTPLDPGRFQAGAKASWRDAAFGEGMGYHGVRNWTGADLGSLLKPLLPAGADPGGLFVLVTAADGYRSVFSGHEVFSAPEGRRVLLADRINGEGLGKGSGRYHAVPEADFFVDRDVRIVQEIRLLRAW